MQSLVPETCSCFPHSHSLLIIEHENPTCIPDTNVSMLYSKAGRHSKPECEGHPSLAYLLAQHQECWDNSHSFCSSCILNSMHPTPVLNIYSNPLAKSFVSRLYSYTNIVIPLLMESLRCFQKSYQAKKIPVQ